MKFLKSFNIEVEKYQRYNRKDILNNYKEISKLKQKMSEVREIKSVNHKNIEKEFGKTIKELRDKYKESQFYFKIIVSHKNSDFKDEFYCDTRKEINNILKDQIKVVINKIKENREEKRRLKKKPRTYKNHRYYLVGLVHEDNGAITKLMNIDKVKKIYRDKKPKTEENHVGVEIECYIEGKQSEVAMALFNKNPDLIDKIALKDDGSLRPNDDEYGAELAIVDHENNINQTVREAIEALQEFNIRVDDKCGLHVHLDMRNRIAEVAFHNLVKAQNLLFKMQHPDREESEYCIKNKKLNIYNYLYERETRYFAINPLSLPKHSTIEIRMHEGTVDIDSINNWINLLLKIVDKKDKTNVKYRAMNSLCSDFNVPKSLMEYSEKRIKEYEVA